MDPLGHRGTTVYDALGRAIKTIDPTGAVTTLAYDAGDNLTQVIDPDGNVTTFAYDALGEQTGTTDPRGKRATYVYDLAGRLASSTDRLGRTIAYSYDAADEMTGQTWKDAGGSVTQRLYGNGVDEPLARVGGADTAWYYQDIRGSVTALANLGGTVQSDISYDGFGNATINSGATFTDRYGYTGRELDAATGLINERARWYNPKTGTFTSQDPEGFGAGDYNLSRYAGNGPTNATDPSGQYLVVTPPADAWYREQFRAMGINVVSRVLPDGRVGFATDDLAKLAQLRANLPPGDSWDAVLAALGSNTYHVEAGPDAIAQFSPDAATLDAMRRLQGLAFDKGKFSTSPGMVVSYIHEVSEGLTGGSCSVLAGINDGATSLLHAVIHPINTLNGMGQFTIALVRDPDGTIRAVAGAVGQAFEDDPSRAFGRLSFELFAAAAGGELGELGEAAELRLATQPVLVDGAVALRNGVLVVDVARAAQYGSQSAQLAGIIAQMDDSCGAGQGPAPRAPRLSAKARDLLDGKDVRAKSISEADELLKETLPNAKKVTGTGPGQSGPPDWGKFKGKDPNGMYHKDYHIDPETGRIYGHGEGNPHANNKHINIKLPDGRKVTITIEPN